MQVRKMSKLTTRYVASLCRVPALCGLITVAGGPAVGHPHIFVDGGVDFVFDDDSLVALHVTWLYDEFETLYILSSYNLSLNAAGGLDEVDRRALVRLRSDWPSDFDGSAHMSIEGEPVPLQWPENLDAQVVDGRLRMTFTRGLDEPAELTGLTAEVAFYEATYFFAFAVTEQPAIVGAVNRCVEEVRKFDPTAEDEGLQATLALLNREETPVMANVGALFADRIILTCA